MNYPVVHVRIQEGRLIARQSRFLNNPNASDPMKYQSQFGYLSQQRLNSESYVLKDSFIDPDTNLSVFCFVAFVPNLKNAIKK